MIDSKLILIEGMAGSGKSTTGQKVLDELSKRGFKAEFYHEFSREHPIIDYSETDKRLWITQTIERWKKLTDKIFNGDKIIILDAAYFQCTIGELLERDADQEEINKYAFRISDVIEPVNPVLIYFYQHDIESTLESIYASRNEKWQNKVCTFLDNTEFGRNNSQTGYELYLEFNKVLRRLTDKIYEQAQINKLAIENSDPNWPSIYEKIFNFLHAI